MAVYHILKDGTQLTDITGHIVKIEDAEPFYRYLHSINQKRRLAKKEREQCEESTSA